MCESEEFYLLEIVRRQNLQITQKALEELSSFLTIFFDINFKEVIKGTNRKAVDIEMLKIIFKESYTELSPCLNVYNFSEKAILHDIMKEQNISYSDETYLIHSSKNFINLMICNVNFTEEAATYLQKYITNFLINFLRSIDKNVVTRQDVMQKINQIINRKNSLSVLDPDNKLNRYITLLNRRELNNDTLSYLNLLCENIIFFMISKSLQFLNLCPNTRYIDHQMLSSSVYLLFDYENRDNVDSYSIKKVNIYENSEKNSSRMHDSNLTINVKIIDEIISKFFDYEKITVKGRIYITAVLEYFLKELFSDFAVNPTVQILKTCFSQDQKCITPCRRIGINFDEIYSNSERDDMNILNFPDNFIQAGSRVKITDEFIDTDYQERDTIVNVDENVSILEQQI